MKATQIKYLFMLSALAERPQATHADLAATVDIPPSLVNRYLRRLAGWGAIKISGRNRKRYDVTPEGRDRLGQASWEFLAFGAELLEALRERTVAALARHAGRRAVLYGATPVADILRRWAADAGLEVVALCDEERPGRNVARLDDLAQIKYDVIVLADRDRADDGVLARLLDTFGTVINPFATDGAAERGRR